LSTTSSEVRLLLIPRLAPPNLLPLKRKRSDIFPPALFNHETAKQVYNIEAIRICDNIYSFQKDRFEHGLIVKSYNIDSVSMSLSTIPLESFSRFRESCHPKLTAFPRPLEWCFAKGDAVYVVNAYPIAYKSGVISTIRDDLAELETDEGILYVPWVKICKIIHVGDFVEVTGGMHKGQKGWVDKVDFDFQIANVIHLVDKEKLVSDHCEVCPTPNKRMNDHLKPIFPSDVRGEPQCTEARHCSICTWSATEAFRRGSTT
jgi:ribosomal protein L24